MATILHVAFISLLVVSNARDIVQYKYSIDEFQLSITNSSELFEVNIYYNETFNSFPVFSITHKYSSSLPFIQVAFASLMQEPITSGNFQDFLSDQQYHYTSSSLTIDSIQQNSANHHVIITGSLLFSDNDYKSIAYTFTLRPPSLCYPFYDDPNKAIKSNQSIDFNITLANDIDINRIYLRYKTNASESFMGFGEQYSFINFRNKIVPILISEQGVGRGIEPVTSYLNNASNGAGGYWHTSYGAKPLYITNYKRSFLLYNYEIIIFDLTHDDYVQVEVYINDTNMISGRIIYGETANDLISEITQVTGRQKPLPEWILRGGIIGVEGGQQAVYDKILSVIQYAQSQDAELCLIGLWIQDWVGTHTFAEDGTRLLWNWELNTNHYPDWNGLFADLSKLNQEEIRRLTYINPYFANVSYLSQGGFQYNYFEEGIDNNYFIMNTSDSPYLIHSLSIDFATVDLTNPAAVQWVKTIIQQNMIHDTNISGFMADFGEYVPYDAVFYDKNIKASFYHNQFAQEWAQIVRDAIHEVSDEEIIPFHRSSSLLSPRYARAFWFGDQFVTFDSRDGIESVLYAMFSASIMGHVMTHSDIGGYTMLNIEENDAVLFNYTRSEELLLRWLELSAFADMIFRSHPGNIPHTSSQIYSSNAAMSHFIKFSAVFKSLSTYKMKLMNDYYASGAPIIRHLFFNYANDATIRKVVEEIKDLDHDDSNPYYRNDEYVVINQEFLLGDCLLMAPVLYPNITAKTIYLPKGRWTSYWDKEVVYNSDGQFYYDVLCPLGEPPVFVCDSWN